MTVNENKENKKSDDLIIGFGVSLIIVAIFNSLLTLGKELLPPVKDLTIVVGSLIGIPHHWVGHGIIIILLFILLGLLFSQESVSKMLVKVSDQRILLILIVASLFIGFGIIGLFFFLDAFLL